MLDGARTWAAAQFCRPPTLASAKSLPLPASASPLAAQTNCRWERLSDTAGTGRAVTEAQQPAQPVCVDPPLEAQLWAQPPNSTSWGPPRSPAGHVIVPYVQ